VKNSKKLENKTPIHFRSGLTAPFFRVDKKPPTSHSSSRRNPDLLQDASPPSCRPQKTHRLFVERETSAREQDRKTEEAI
jgi:hypothetical protein